MSSSSQLETFEFLARFNQFVNNRLYPVIGGLPEDDYRREAGAYFGSIFQTVNHLLVVDTLWTTRLTGEPNEHIASLKHVLCPEFTDLGSAREEMDEKIIATVASLSPQDLDRSYSFLIRTTGSSTTMQGKHILLAMFNHQTHHRGQIHCLLTQMGHEIPGLDVPEFVR